MFSSPIYHATLVNYRCTGGFTYFALHFIHATFCIEPRRWNGSFYGGIQHTLPLKLRLSLNGGGSTPYISLQGKGSGYQYYGLSLNRSFLKEDRLSVNLYCNNIFEKYRSYNNHTEGANFVSKSSSKWPSRSFGVSVSYRIGELKASVKKAARSISNDDVKGGGGGGNAGGGGGQ